MYGFAGRGNVIDDIRFDVGRGDFGLIVGAVVVADVEMIDARKQMIVRSFFEVMSFAFHDCDNRKIVQE